MEESIGTGCVRSKLTTLRTFCGTVLLVVGDLGGTGGIFADPASLSFSSFMLASSPMKSEYEIIVCLYDRMSAYAGG